MEKIIAVENSLGPVKDFLKSKGCRVVDASKADSYDVDAVVVSGADINLMNIEDMLVDAPVISADGMTPEQIWERIRQH